MSRERASIGCAVVGIAAYGAALGLLRNGYPHALATACPDGAPAPAGFWPLLLAAIVLALVAFGIGPERTTRVHSFALLVALAVPLAAGATALGYGITYACWE